MNIVFLFLQVGLFSPSVIASLNFENITSLVFPQNSGIIAAFGHFNSDEFTDVFSLQQGGKKLQIFKWNDDENRFQLNTSCNFSSFITNVIPGDFNGDSVTDVLIILNDRNSVDQHVGILWGSLSYSLNCTADIVFPIINQPLIVDYNRDMIPDIIAENKMGEIYVWISHTNNTFSKMDLSKNINQKFRNPHSSGLIDLNNDLAADILISGDKSMEILENTAEGFSKSSTIQYPSSFPKLHVYHNLQSTFVDINLDAKLDHIMPVCYDDDCQSAAILMWHNNTNGTEWKKLFDNFKDDNGITWGFKLPEKHAMPKLPVTLRAGDVDMDGYPDFLAILQPNSKSLSAKPVIFHNIVCSSNHNSVFDRCLKIIWDIPGLQDISNVEIVAFFDIYEDGILDILASSKDNNEWKIHALKNKEIIESYFMKVLVLNVRCRNCTSREIIPYGVNQPGPIVQYNMTNQDGHSCFSSAIQISQTAYFPLQLPYSLFGLGQTPNFIDTLTSAVPAKFTEGGVPKHKWTQIIPNSQIVVIRNPPYEEKEWVIKLFVTSHYVLFTCIAFIGTCAFVAVLIALLHWRERKEDKKEKMQDAYRFHFDAM